MSLLGRGHLSVRMYQDVSCILQAGVLYTLAVQADDPTVAFDLDLFDENGNQVSTSPVTGDAAMCQVRPLWTGPFTIRVTCLRGASFYSLVSEP